MWQTHSINSYLNSSTRNKWKTVVHTAWTHNCNFRSPEQCVEMLLKHFFVCYPFCGKFLCCIFQANVAVERQPEYLEKISSISLILVDWPFCCMEATFWQGDEVRKVDLLVYMNLWFSWILGSYPGNSLAKSMIKKKPYSFQLSIVFIVDGKRKEWWRRRKPILKNWVRKTAKWGCEKSEH